MRYYLSAISSLLIFCSCSSHAGNENAVFRSTEKALLSANMTIYNNTQTIYRSLEDKLSDARSKERAMIWVPRARMAQELSEKLVSYI